MSDLDENADRRMSSVLIRVNPFMLQKTSRKINNVVKDSGKKISVNCKS